MAYIFSIWLGLHATFIGIQTKQQQQQTNYLHTYKITESVFKIYEVLIKSRHSAKLILEALLVIAHGLHFWNESMCRRQSKHY